MCLLAIAIHASARWPLVIASNRDEFYARPSLPLARWTSAAGQTIISGRDARAGGTWLGMTPSGRMALLTNVREAPSATPLPAQKSRGDLVMRWLESSMNAEQFMAQTDCHAYAGFNLIVGDALTDRWTWLSNRWFDTGAPGVAAQRPQRLPRGDWCWKALTPGVYGLSNAALDTPWPKTLALRTALAAELKNDKHGLGIPALQAALWAALANRQQAGLNSLPDTGLSLAQEQALSSAFVDSPERAYGTRCSTLLVASAVEPGLCGGLWQVQVEERTPALRGESHDDAASVQQQRTVREVFQWGGARLPD